MEHAGRPHGKVDDFLATDAYILRLIQHEIKVGLGPELPLGLTCLDRSRRPFRPEDAVLSARTQ